MTQCRSARPAGRSCRRPPTAAPSSRSCSCGAGGNFRPVMRWAQSGHLATCLSPLVHPSAPHALQFCGCPLASAAARRSRPPPLQAGGVRQAGVGARSSDQEVIKSLPHSCVMTEATRSCTPTGSGPSEFPSRYTMPSHGLRAPVAAIPLPLDRCLNRNGERGAGVGRLTASAMAGDAIRHDEPVAHMPGHCGETISRVVQYLNE